MLVLAAAGARGEDDVPVPAWHEAYSAGAEADDNADYKIAEARLGEACDIAVKLGDAAGQEHTCGKLADVLAIQSQYKRAEAVLVELIAGLEAIENVEANLVVKSRLEMANVRSAQAKFREANDALEGIGPYLDRLRASDLAEAYITIAQFYLPIERHAPGGDMLRSAREALEQRPNFDDVRYVRAGGRLARVLQDGGRLREADEVLTLFVEEGWQRFRSGQSLESELENIYIELGSQYAQLQRVRGRKGRAKEIQAGTDLWRETLGGAAEPRGPRDPRQVRAAGPGRPDTARRTSEGNSAPKLIKKVEPKMTKGALANKARGSVELSLEVWPDGRPHNVRVVRPLPYGLHWEAVGAVRKWRFVPGKKDGEPVKVSAWVEVNFAFR